tara:strand:- start:1364 stop:2281 length:918 start_codon:yes stop_codon:yes gene_type:complete
MILNNVSYNRIRKKYYKFLNSQEVLSEPFRDKVGQLKNFYLPLSQSIFKEFSKDKKTKIIGLTGGQGSGKSTISKILKIILKEGFSLSTVIFSIDDFYKTLRNRKIMSYKISPLFLTRGVPGTHDTALLYKCIKNLKSSKFKEISIPRFDKSIDDRVLKKKWQKVKKKPDIVIFEGWCVGATPQKKKDLLVPINDLEKTKDKKRIWRETVNKELNNRYKKIFKLIDKFIFLKVPSFKHVHRWRLLQEKKLRLTTRGKKTMNDNQIKNFIMFYERLTKHMLKNFDKIADISIKLDGKHRLKIIRFD